MSQFLTDLSTLADRVRDRVRFTDLSLLRLAIENGLGFSVNDVRELLHRFPDAGMYTVPSVVTDVAARLVARRPAASIWDPFAKLGTFLIPVAEQLRGVQEVVASCPNDDIVYYGSHIKTDLTIHWELLDLSHTNAGNREFEVILSSPPIGVRRETQRVVVGDAERDVNDSPGYLVALRALHCLSPRGIAVFLVANDFFLRESSQSVRNVLAEFGFGVTACLSLPAGALRPFASIPACLVTIERGIHQELFAAELGDATHNGEVVKNFLERRQARSLHLGRLVPAADFKGFGDLLQADRIQRMVRQSGCSGVPLGDLIVEQGLVVYRGNNAPQGHEDAVYLPLTVASAATTNPANLTSKTAGCVELILDRRRVLPEYLALYFNQPLGREIRALHAYGITNLRVTVRELKGMLVYLPPLEDQQRTVECEAEIGSLSSTLSGLRSQSWSAPRDIKSVAKKLEKFGGGTTEDSWINALPFPLATILWAEYAAGPDYTRRVKHLLHFFEALAQFVAIIHLSALTNAQDLFDSWHSDILNCLRTRGLSLDQSTFGVWQNITGILAKRVRGLLGGGGDSDLVRLLYCCSDPDSIRPLCSKKLVVALEMANRHRNSWLGHTGADNDKVSRERTVMLKSLLGDIRDEQAEFWTRYELIQPRACKIRKGVHFNEVGRIMGNRTPFQVVERPTRHGLETDELYLLGNCHDEALRLLPLMRVMPSPSTEQNACYYYNRRQTGGIRFLSYHFEAEAEIIGSFADTDQVLTRFWPSHAES